MGSSHSSAVIATPNPGLNIGSVVDANGNKVGISFINSSTPKYLQNLSVFGDLYNPKPTSFTTSTSSHSSSTSNYVMPTVITATDMHSGSHSQFTTVTAPTINKNTVDLSGT